MAQPSAQVIQAATVADLYVSAAATADAVAYPGSGKLKHAGVVVVVVAVPSVAKEQPAAAVIYKATGESDAACLWGVLASGAMWKAMATPAAAACTVFLSVTHVLLAIAAPSRQAWCCRYGSHPSVDLLNKYPLANYPELHSAIASFLRTGLWGTEKSNVNDMSPNSCLCTEQV
jgi:hypothetical protein